MVRFNSRLSASFVHFMVSISIVSLFTCLVLFIWYPSPFDYFYTPFNVLKVVIGVALVLGPMMTLILYDIKKPKLALRTDIFLVVTFQLTAFIWGVYVTCSSRPVILVFSNDTFYMFARDELNLSNLKQKELNPKVWMSPKLAYIDPPKNSAELDQLYREYWFEGKPEITLRTDRYLPWKEGFKQSSAFSINMSDFIEDREKKKALDAFLNNAGGTVNEYDFYPVKGTNKKATLVFNRSNGELAGLIEYVF